MHDTALRIGHLALEVYGAAEQARILEVGSFDVNGSLRSKVPAGSTYIGVDLTPGPGVDMVIQPGAPLPVDDESFDLVFASSVLEHDPAFWVTFVEMARKLRMGGHLYINVPSNGAVHRYPEDHWRFYPDSGLALVRWAESQGQSLQLVESFLADREEDIWNDFVAVFRKGKKGKSAPKRYLHQLVPSTNIRVEGVDVILTERAETQDMALIAQAMARAEEVRLELSAAQAAEARVAGEVQQWQVLADERLKLYELATAHLESLEARAAVSQRDLEETRALLAEQQGLAEQRHVELVETRHGLATLESALIQRQEQVAQTEAALEDANARVNVLETQVQEMEANEARLAAKLGEADAWVFQLAGERQVAERESAMARSEVESYRKQVGGLEADLTRLAEAADLAARRLTAAEQAHARALGGVQVAHQAALQELRVEVERAHESHRAAEQAHAKALGGVQVAHQAVLQELRVEVERAHESHRAAEQARSQAEQARMQAEQALVQGEQALAERFNESAMLTRLLLECEVANDREVATREWLREVNAALATRPGWWSLLPRSWRQRCEHRQLMTRGLFDARGYLELYPDVAAARMDPLRHYILHGMNEGRRLTR